MNLTEAFNTAGVAMMDELNAKGETELGKTLNILAATNMAPMIQEAFKLAVQSRNIGPFMALVANSLEIGYRMASLPVDGITATNKPTDGVGDEVDFLKKLFERS